MDEVALLISPDGTILSGSIHMDILYQHPEDLPPDLGAKIREVMGTGEEFGFMQDTVVATEKEVMDELINRGWCRARVRTGEELNLQVNAANRSNVLNFLSILPPDILDVNKLRVDIDDDFLEVKVREDEDAMSAFQKRGGAKYYNVQAKEKEYTWDEIKSLVDQLGIAPDIIYSSLGGPDREQVDAVLAWAWLEQETEPAEVVGFLRYQFGKDMRGLNDKR